MKKYLAAFLICSSFFVSASFGVNSWVQKSDIATATTVARKNAVAFAIGTKGYITTGLASAGVKLKDTWEYNQSTSAWTQKADFGGSARYAAVGFAVGNYGYVGTGNDGAEQTNFYKYDPSGNAWTVITAFPGAARRSACAFATSTDGYVGLGFSSSPFADFYKYNPGTGMWTTIAAFPGGTRYLAVAASVNNKGYVGTGLSGATYYQDWYEYNPTGNSWVVRTGFTGGMRAEAMAFGVSGKIFVGTGNDNNNVQKIDCWEFDPTGNTWTVRADVALNTFRRNGAVGFAIGGYGYCATGTGPNGVMKDLYEYTPLTGVEELILRDNSVSVYPNPSKGNMTVQYEFLKNVSGEFLLMDLLGNLVASYEMNATGKSLKIEEPSLSDGIYYYRVLVKDKLVTSGKILIAK